MKIKYEDIIDYINYDSDFKLLYPITYQELSLIEFTSYKITNTGIILNHPGYMFNSNMLDLDSFMKFIRQRKINKFLELIP